MGRGRRRHGPVQRRAAGSCGALDGPAALFPLGLSGDGGLRSAGGRGSVLQPRPAAVAVPPGSAFPCLVHRLLGPGKGPRGRALGPGHPRATTAAQLAGEAPLSRYGPDHLPQHGARTRSAGFPGSASAAPSMPQRRMGVD